MKVFACMAFAVAMAAGAASAQGVPDGSYLETCDNVRMRGDTLSATCATRNGRAVQSSLRNAMDCSGGIENINGRLACSGQGGAYYGGDRYGNGGYGASDGYAPGGSYLRSCTDVSVSGDTLYATCQTRNGRAVQSELRGIQRYQGGDISNCNGTLRPGRC
ncbi:CVNH domain-containing protein [Azospirillum sp. TSO22-1]|uniref:CVNH domain-containing protein n=1 Tax=Azospirillum sp. TSO22-1 TaxID=716789 RepID=UPI000D61B83A|nr:CVNH domain-containing protein [Azospirillum sp. TSO22-1]PWC54736.1 hypothetical protein TSO221_07310 [Azospirillum sp. TSO22-1]